MLCLCGTKPCTESRSVVCAMLEIADGRKESVSGFQSGPASVR